MSMSGNVTVGVNLLLKTTDAAGGYDQKVAALGTAARSISNGNAANQGTKFCEFQVALAGSTPQTYDLTALVNQDGTSVNFSAVKGYFFDNLDTNDGDVVKFKPGASNPITRPFGGTTPTLEVPAGSPVYLGNHLSSGWPVSGTAKTFTLDPGAAGQTVNVVVWGT